MRTLHLFLVLFALGTQVQAQSFSFEGSFGNAPAAAKTIEGFWQDTARRILFARNAPPSYVYGRWTLLDQGQTYPSAKQILRSATAFKVIDLLYDDQHVIRVLSANEKGIEFVRSTSFPACGMHHRCRLDGDEMFCSLENICRESGREVLDWKGEERYARRAHCERGPRAEAQGIPHRCQ